MGDGRGTALSRDIDMAIGKTWPYIPGEHLALCDFCGRKFYRSQLRRTWQGYLACEQDYDEKHPQLDVKILPEKPFFPDSSPEGEDVFSEPGDVTADDL